MVRLGVLNEEAGWWSGSGGSILHICSDRLEVRVGLSPLLTVRELSTLTGPYSKGRLLHTSELEVPFTVQVSMPTFEGLRESQGSGLS